MINDDKIKQILIVATHAISPYNTQPWRFKLTDNGVDIFILRSKNFFLKLEGVLEFTLGALLENLVEGAKSFGFSATWDRINPIQDLDKPCVSVTFTPKSTTNYSIDHVLNRRTNRTPYSSTLLSEQHKQRLHQTINNTNIDLTFVENEEKSHLAEILEELEYNRLSNKKMVNEMLNYIRTSNDTNTDNKSLLDVNILGVSEQTIQLIKNVKSNAILRYINQLLGIIPKEKRRIRHLLDNSGAILVISLIQHNYLELVETGRIIQRLLNEMQRLGITSMSCISGLYLFDVLAENPEIFSNKEKNAILNCKWDMELLLNNNTQKISFIIRAGYMKQKVPATSQRKPMNDLLLS